MQLSFYSAAVNASSHQKRIDVVANNIANINTDGYKAKNAGFVDLIYQNIRRPADEVTDLKNGSGTRVGKVDTSFMPGAAKTTDSPFDYFIEGDGLFAVYNKATDTISYTRAGSFHMSQGIDGKFYLAAPNGDLVLSSTKQPIQVTSPEDKLDIGVFDFPNKDGMLSVGNTYYSPLAKNGAPFLATNARLERKMVEASNVNMTNEMTILIQEQRAFQMNLKMLQTSDEITQNIQNLR